LWAPGRGRQSCAPTTGGRKLAMVCRFYRQRQWGGGLARRAITAATTVAVPTIVATSMTAVVVLGVVLVLVATVVAVDTTGRARRREGWWPGCWGHSVSVECCWGSQRTYIIHVDLLQ
jgi:hypothetical protein